MKKQLNQLRRFFSRTGARKLNAATAREVIPASYEDDDSSNRLSGAFIVVLVLHVIALVGVFAFSRMKDPKPSSSGDRPASETMAVSGAAPLREVTPERASASTSAASPEPAQHASLQPPKHAATTASETGAAVDRSPVESLRPGARAGSRSPHIVKNGENLTKIAFAYGVRASDLMSANNLKNDEIKPGQELVVPEPKVTRGAPEQKTGPLAEKPTPPKTTPTTHKVRKNETLAKIAKELGVDYDELSRLNGIKNPRKLQEGQVLKVPKRS
jgi:LysM repeat protein